VSLSSTQAARYQMENHSSGRYARSGSAPTVNCDDSPGFPYRTDLRSPPAEAFDLLVEWGALDFESEQVASRAEVRSDDAVHLGLRTCGDSSQFRYAGHVGCSINRPWQHVTNLMPPTGNRGSSPASI